MWRVDRKILAAGDESRAHRYAPRPVRLMLFLPHLAFRPAKKIILVSRLHSTQGIVPLSGLIFGALNLLTEM